MFDWYRPSGSLKCPRCGTPLREWQGKDGPCSLFVWEQGAAHPVAQETDDEEARWTRQERTRFVLPEPFDIYSYDCPKHQPVEAKCRTRGGVWTETVVVDPGAGRQ